MVRLTLILAVIILCVMIIVPGDDPAPLQTAESADAPQTVRGPLETDALRETEDGTVVLTTSEGEELTIDLVIEPSALTEADAQVNLPPAQATGGVAPVEPDAAAGEETADVPTEPEAVAPAPDIPATAGVLLRVTGDRVNFRAGPSTDDAILAALTQGTEVELIERVADGWAHLRVPQTGLSGYMSEDFLEPAN